MSTDKPCPFCSANSDQHTAVHAVCVRVRVDDDPITTADRLFDALRPMLAALSAVYDGHEKFVFWQVVIGRFTAAVVDIVGPSWACSLMRLAHSLAGHHAARQTTGRPN